MSWFLIAVAVVALGLALLKAASTVNPAVLVLWIRRIIAGLLAAFAVLMFFVGRVPMALLLASFAVMVMRGGGSLPWGRLGGKPAAGQSSSVETKAFSMTLDHDTGEMEGEVKSGEFAGRNLNDLTKGELLLLLESLKRDDQRSAAVLVAYLDRRFGSDWQDEDPAPGAASSGQDGPMTREVALEILGLAKGASRDEIIQAHRRLMQKLHPDHGGSGYLASRINAARDLLVD